MDDNSNNQRLSFRTGLHPVRDGTRTGRRPRLKGKVRNRIDRFRLWIGPAEGEGCGRCGTFRCLGTSPSRGGTVARGGDVEGVRGRGDCTDLRRIIIESLTGEGAMGDGGDWIGPLLPRRC